MDLKQKGLERVLQDLHISEERLQDLHISQQDLEFIGRICNLVDADIASSIQTINLRHYAIFLKEMTERKRLLEQLKDQGFGRPSYAGIKLYPLQINYLISKKSYRLDFKQPRI